MILSLRVNSLGNSFFFDWKTTFKLKTGAFFLKQHWILFRISNDCCARYYDAKISSFLAAVSSTTLGTQSLFKKLLIHVSIIYSTHLLFPSETFQKEITSNFLKSNFIKSVSKIQFLYVIGIKLLKIRKTSLHVLFL